MLPAEAARYWLSHDLHAHGWHVDVKARNLSKHLLIVRDSIYVLPKVSLFLHPLLDELLPLFESSELLLGVPDRSIGVGPVLSLVRRFQLVPIVEW